MSETAGGSTSVPIEKEDHFIEALDPGIQLHVREKRPRGFGRAEAANVLLCVHGQSTPAPVSFDFPLPGYSWMDYVAARGFDVFCLSLRGYGLSTRPPEMERDPAGVNPIVRGRVAVRDIEAAVRFICERREVDRLNLLGWSFGTTTTAAFTSTHGEFVRRLTLYAPFYAYDHPGRAAEREDPARPGRFDPRMGAWRWVTEEVQRERWDGSIPAGQHEKWREEKAIRTFWEAQLALDPAGQNRTPPAVRVPNGAMADAYDRTRNIPLYDASLIRCPVLLIRGDHDRSTFDPDVWGLYRALANSFGKRCVLLGQGTHFMQFERRRGELFSEVQNFLET